MKRKQSVVIVGGGSTYTLGMIMSLIAEKENFPLGKLVLYDTDKERQTPIAKATEVILKEKYPEMESFIYTTSKSEAFSDIDFAFLQIRVGGLEMRKRDEEIPLSYGVVGQETCGAGGMAYGLRSIGPMISLVEEIRTYSKDAWILNYTNPAAIVSIALKQAFPEDTKILNICDMPVAIMVSYAELLDIEIWDLIPEYFGLNHFGWFTNIYDKRGNTYIETLKQKITEGEFLPKDAEIANDPSWQATFKQAKHMIEMFPDYLPNTYLQYYFYPKQLVSKEDPTYTRASQVIGGREKRVFEHANQIIKDQNSSSVDLESDIHGRYMIRIAASLAFSNNDIFIVMTENNGIIENLPGEAIVEVPALLSAQGISPLHVGKIPVFYKGILENQYAYERLVIDAYLENSYLKALQALTLNRTIIDADTAKQLLDDLIKANEGYWPQLR